MLTLGAVVLTLNATGWSLLLVTDKVRRTSCVRGPAQQWQGKLASPTPHIKIEKVIHC